MCLRVDVTETRKIKRDIKNFQFYKEFRYRLDDNSIRFSSPYQGSSYDLPGTFYEDDTFTKERIKEIQTRYYLLESKCLHVYCSSKEGERPHQGEIYSCSSFSYVGFVTMDIVVEPQHFIAAGVADDLLKNVNEAAVTEFTVTDAEYKKVLKSIMARIDKHKDNIPDYDKIMKILK